MLRMTMDVNLLLVIQSEAKNLGYIHVCGHLCVTEILPPFGRLNDR